MSRYFFPVSSCNGSYKQIHESITVHISTGHTLGDIIFCQRQTRSFKNIGECGIAVVFIQYIIIHTAGDIQIFKAVVVIIDNTSAAAKHSFIYFENMFDPRSFSYIREMMLTKTFIDEKIYKK